MFDHLSRLALLSLVDDAGSVSEAARRLGLGKSVVSHHLVRLERDTGSQLIDRSRHRAGLTSLGQKLASHGRQIIEEGRLAAEAVRSFEEPTGRLSVSTPSGIADAVLVPMLAAFRLRYPGLSIDITATDDYLDLDRMGIDIGFRIGVEPDSPYVSQRLLTAQRIFCGSPDYLATIAPIRRPADLSAHPFIAHARSGKTPIYTVIGTDGSHVEVQVRASVTTSSGTAIRDWCLAGAGLARLPDFAVRHDLAAGRLTAVLPGFSSSEASISAVYRPHRNRPANINRLLDHARNWFREINPDRYPGSTS
jgi:DNA-binding transcriptional LysR family regulator